MNRLAIMSCLFAPVVLLLAALAGCGHTTIAAGSHDTHEVEDDVELATIMGEMQRHSMKLGYAINAQNQRLAEFYLHEVEETLEEIKAVREHDGLPIGHIAGVIVNPALPPLDNAIEAGDWTAANKAYQGLIEACNNCHTATQHEFIVILPATGTPPFNQKF